MSVDQSSWSPCITYTNPLLEIKGYFSSEDHDLILSLPIYLTVSHCCYICSVNRTEREDVPSSSFYDCTGRQISCWDICPFNVTLNQPDHLPITSCHPDTVLYYILSCFKWWYVVIMGLENIWINWYKYSQVHTDSLVACIPLQVLRAELLGYFSLLSQTTFLQ